MPNFFFAGGLEIKGENRGSPKIFNAAQHTQTTTTGTQQEPWNLMTSVHLYDANHTFTHQTNTLGPFYMHLRMGNGWERTMEAGYPLIKGGVRARCWREWRTFYFWDRASLTNLAMQDGFRYWWGDSSGGTHKFEWLDNSFWQKYAQHALKYASYLGSFSIESN